MGLLRHGFGNPGQTEIGGGTQGQLPNLNYSTLIGRRATRIKRGDRSHEPLPSAISNSCVASPSGHAFAASPLFWPPRRPSPPSRPRAHSAGSIFTTQKIRTSSPGLRGRCRWRSGRRSARSALFTTRLWWSRLTAPRRTRRPVTTPSPSGTFPSPATWWLRCSRA